MRLILLALFVSIHSVGFYATATFVFVGLAMLLAILQPYKADFSTYNTVDLVLMLTLAMWFGTVVFFDTITAKSRELLDITVIVLYLLAVSPLLYLVVIFGHWICSHTGVRQSIKSRMERVFRRTHGTRLDKFLPDDGGDFLMANDNERFSDPVYSSISHEESTML